MDAAARGPVYHIKGGWVSGVREDGLRDLLHAPNGAAPGRTCSVGIQTVKALVNKGMLVKMDAPREGDRLATYELPGY